LPPEGDVQRVVRELDLPVVVALVEADALAAFNVYRRYYFDGILLVW